MAHKMNNFGILNEAAGGSRPVWPWHILANFDFSVTRLSYFWKVLAKFFRNFFGYFYIKTNVTTF